MKLEGQNKEIEGKKGKPKGIFPLLSMKQEGESTAHSTHSISYENAKNFKNPQ